MNLKTNQKGFTLVELLIVIVVIAILAAISIVAYSGIQQRGRDTARASDAANIVKALTAYTTDDTTNGGSAGTWPADAATAVSALNAYKAANLPTTITSKITSTAPSATAKDNYQYQTCGTPVTGASITYWKESSNPAAAVTVKAGSGC